MNSPLNFQRVPAHRLGCGPEGDLDRGPNAAIDPGLGPVAAGIHIFSNSGGERVFCHCDGKSGGNVLLTRSRYYSPFTFP